MLMSVCLYGPFSSDISAFKLPVMLYPYVASKKPGFTQAVSFATRFATTLQKYNILAQHLD